MSAVDCGVLPPGWEPRLANGSPCPLPADGHTEHLTTTPNGRMWRWDGFECAHPEDCQFDGSDTDCCVSFGEVIERTTSDKPRTRTAHVLAEVAEERDRQDAKWGGPDAASEPPEQLLRIIARYKRERDELAEALRVCEADLTAQLRQLEASRQNTLMARHHVTELEQVLSVCEEGRDLLRRDLEASERGRERWRNRGNEAEADRTALLEAIAAWQAGSRPNSSLALLEAARSIQERTGRA